MEMNDTDKRAVARLRAMARNGYSLEEGAAELATRFGFTGDVVYVALAQVAAEQAVLRDRFLRATKRAAMDQGYEVKR